MRTTQAGKANLKIALVGLVALGLIAAAVGVTIWRFENSVSDSRHAASERRQSQNVQQALALFWQERAAINEYILAPSPRILGEIAALAPAVPFPVPTFSVAENRNLGLALDANHRLLALFAAIRADAIHNLSAQRGFDARLRVEEARVLVPLQTLVRLTEEDANVREQRAQAASSQARYAAIVGGVLILAAALVFVGYARRLVTRVVRRETKLGLTLDELQASNDALQRVEAQLRQSQKMEAIGRLAGGIAHDFNNLLTAIRGYGEFLIAGVGQDALRRYACEIVNAADSAASLTHQLLAFSRQQVLQPQLIDLNERVGHVRPMLERLTEADVQIRLELDADLESIEADPIQIEQVLINLAINARDAMHGSGTLVITTANEQDQVLLAVSDNGVGMDERTCALAFDPFFTTKEVGKGTGVGLATAHGIVTQTGGTISIESSLGRGTTVTIRFPAAKGASSASGKPDVVVTTRHGDETILLVEDNAGARAVAAEMLRNHGYTVIETESPLAALKIGGAYDLLLTDVDMPEMNGVELARRLAAPRVLFTSGYDAQKLVSERDTYLQKPFTSESLTSAVRTVLDAEPAARDRVPVLAA